MWCTATGWILWWTGLGWAGLGCAGLLGWAALGLAGSLDWAALAFARLGWAWEAGVRWGVQPNPGQPSQAQAQPSPAKPKNDPQLYSKLFKFEELIQKS